MRLYVEELRAQTLGNGFYRTTTALVSKVRLHLCKYLSPAGTFIVRIRNAEDGTVIAESSQTLADMQAAGSAGLQENYYHGHVTFEFPKAVTLRPGGYNIELTSSGYTFSEEAFIGWVKAYPDRAIDLTYPGDYVPTESPYDFEIYALERLR